MDSPPSTPETGYLEPFPIHDRIDDEGRTVAMADTDLAYWVGGGPRWSEATFRLLLVMGAVAARIWRVLSTRS